MASLSVGIDSINSANVQKIKPWGETPWGLYIATRSNRKKRRQISLLQTPAADAHAAESVRDCRQKRTLARQRDAINGQVKRAASLQAELVG